MRILLSNDDGIHARGLAVLERIARTISDDVTVVAPIDEQSGKGRSLTLSRPLRLVGRGRRATAVEVQRRLADMAAAFVATGEAEEAVPGAGGVRAIESPVS